MATPKVLRDHLSKAGKHGAAALYGKLTPRQRRMKARKAAKARWAKVRQARLAGENSP